MSANKKRILKIFGIIALVYVVFAIVVLTLFHYVSTNPMDKAAMTYLWNSTDVEDRHGEITHIGRNLLYKTEETETTVKAPYTIEAGSDFVTVYVTLVNNEEEWEAVSYEVIEVKENAK